MRTMIDMLICRTIFSDNRSNTLISFYSRHIDRGKFDLSNRFSDSFCKNLLIFPLNNQWSMDHLSTICFLFFWTVVSLSTRLFTHWPILSLPFEQFLEQLYFFQLNCSTRFPNQIGSRPFVSLSNSFSYSFSYSRHVNRLRVYRQLIRNNFSLTSNSSVLLVQLLKNLKSFSLSLSLCLSVSLSLCLSMFLSISLSLSLYVSLCLCLSLSLCLSHFLSLSLSFSLSHTHTHTLTHKQKE